MTFLEKRHDRNKENILPTYLRNQMNLKLKGQIIEINWAAHGSWPFSFTENDEKEKSIQFI